MGTASFEFLGFALCVVMVFNLFGALAWRQFVLLAASLLFLTFFSTSPLAWVPFAAFLAFGYVSLRLLQTGAGARGFLPMIVATIAAFVWLKKYAFIPPGLFLHYPYVTLGLSYIFFRLLHLLIDAHGGQIAERVSPASYLNYTLNFTTLLSGPIQTYQGFAAYQLAPEPLRLDIVDAGQAVERIVVGFFKVNVLSLTLSMLQTQALATLHAADPFGARVLQGMLIVGIYPLYLYCNFSGYIDMVIGIARFLRIELPENFNRPFSATNFMMFWSRWHITLSQWLRTYVYNTLLIAGMRRFQGAAIAPYLSVVAIFVTFFLVGLWHGQSAEFLFFGLLQGGGVGAVQLYQTVMTKRLGKKGYKSLAANALYMALCRGLTFAWFAFTLLWFWSSWTQIGGLAAKMGPEVIATAGVGLLIAATVILALWEILRAGALSVTVGGGPLLASRYCRVVIGTAVAVISIATVALVNAPAPDLVYKAF